MLPPEVLKLLRQWWSQRPAKYDAGVAKTDATCSQAGRPPR